MKSQKTTYSKYHNLIKWILHEILDITATAGTGGGNDHSCHVFFSLGLFIDAFDCPLYVTSNNRIINCEVGKGSVRYLISDIIPALARKWRKTSVTVAKMWHVFTYITKKKSVTWSLQRLMKQECSSISFPWQNTKSFPLLSAEIKVWWARTAGFTEHNVHNLPTYTCQMYFHLRSVYLTPCTLFVPAHSTRDSPWTLMIQGFYAASTSKVSDVSKGFSFPTICLSTRRNIPEDLNLKKHCWKNFKPRTLWTLFWWLQTFTLVFYSFMQDRQTIIRREIHSLASVRAAGTAYARECVLSDFTHLTSNVGIHKFS